MRKTIKEQILRLLLTLQEAHKEIAVRCRNSEVGTVRTLLADCQDGAVLIGNTIEQSESGQEELIKALEEYCERLFLINDGMEHGEQINGEAVKKELDKRISDIYHEITVKIKGVLKVVFFPYKASMWTSLESIWKAAQADEECEAKVVVIPYFTLDSMGNKQELIYEADLFPDYVPVVHYSMYQVEQEHPDMIFIHNPYDETNNVTRVPEKYYSYNLKPYTEQLIYSPYGMMGHYSPEQGSFMCCTNAVHVADKVLVQSERVKRIYMAHGVEEEKLLALGSPKVDAIVELGRKPIAYPKEWEKKLQGRKVFLLNTHLSYFVKGFKYQVENPGSRNFTEHNHELVFHQLIDREGCALIWRPHPLLKAMLESRNIHGTLEWIEKWEQRIRESENSVIDENGEYDISFQLSDALITTYSSIIPEYMISGKPVYIYQGRLNEKNCKNSPVDYTHNYYRARGGEEPKLPGFIQMVLDGEDYLYEKRMADVKRAFTNLEGTIGQRIYERLKKDYDKEQ